MKRLNLINSDRSDIKFEIFTFPDGEVHFQFLEELDRKDNGLYVIARITNADDLFVLMQINDVLSRQEIYWELHLKYLMSMRMDRVMDFNRPYSLKIVANILNGFSCHKITIFSPHSDKSLDLISNSCPEYFIFKPYIDKNAIIVFPDAGCMERLNHFTYDYLFVAFEKVRDVNTGKLLSFEYEKSFNESSNEHFIFIDDLCDGGGTFIGELEILKKDYPNAKFDLIVTHAVNYEGLLKVCSYFDNVLTTNSYGDWKYTIYSKIGNLKVIDVCL